MRVIHRSKHKRNTVSEWVFGRAQLLLSCRQFARREPRTPSTSTQAFQIDRPLAGLGRSVWQSSWGQPSFRPVPLDWLIVTAVLFILQVAQFPISFLIQPVLALDPADGVSRFAPIDNQLHSTGWPWPIDNQVSLPRPTANGVNSLLEGVDNSFVQTAAGSSHRSVALAQAVVPLDPESLAGELAEQPLQVEQPLPDSNFTPPIEVQYNESASNQSPSTLTTSSRGRPSLGSILSRKLGHDYGFGFERVMFAPTTIDTAISSPYLGLRVRSERGLGSPDRLEYLWARAGSGPEPETRVDLIDFVYRTEIGNDKAAIISELGMRALNPEINPNTVGYGDMVVGAKALVYDGKCTKFSSLFLSYFNTGPVDRGLGTGHIALEPGVLMRHQWSDATYLHGQVKYRIPIAGSAGFAGDVVNTGWAISTIWRDSDQIALLPTFEVQTNSFLFGGLTDSSGTVRRVDSVTAVEVFPGMRFAFGKSAIGPWEAGFAAGVTCADRDWFDSRLMFDLRWLR
jgi:hypothetical protein